MFGFSSRDVPLEGLVIDAFDFDFYLITERSLVTRVELWFGVLVVEVRVGARGISPGISTLLSSRTTWGEMVLDGELSGVRPVECCFFRLEYTRSHFACFSRSVMGMCHLFSRAMSEPSAAFNRWA
jgi:hypothetical protein